jgi:hypothetical protein
MFKIIIVCLNSSNFPMLLHLLLHNLSLFPSATIPSPFFVSLFVPIPYFPSIFFNSFHQSLPLYIFHFVFEFCFLPLLFSNSCFSFSYSSEVSSHEHTFFSVFFSCIFNTSSCCLHICAVYCHYFFPRFIAYMYVSFHISFFFSLFLSLFFNPQFHPPYYSPRISSFFLTSFWSLAFPLNCTLSVTTFLFFPSFVSLPMFLPDPLSQIVSRSPKTLLLFFLNPLRSHIMPSLLPFSLFFFLWPPLRIFSLLCPFITGSHFFSPSTFSFIQSPFPLSLFSPYSIPPPNEKFLVSPFLHSFSCTPSIVIFLYPTFTFFPFLSSSCAMVLCFFCVVRSLSMNISSVSFFSLSFPFCFITFTFSLHSSICTSTYLIL